MLQSLQSGFVRRVEISRNGPCALGATSMSIVSPSQSPTFVTATNCVPVQLTWAGLIVRLQVRHCRSDVIDQP